MKNKFEKMVLGLTFILSACSSDNNTIDVNSAKKLHYDIEASPLFISGVHATFDLQSQFVLGTAPNSDESEHCTFFLTLSNDDINKLKEGLKKVQYQHLNSKHIIADYSGHYITVVSLDESTERFYFDEYGEIGQYVGIIDETGESIKSIMNEIIQTAKDLTPEC